MKKILILFLCSFVAVSLVGCKENNSRSNTSSSVPVASSASQESPESQEESKSEYKDPDYTLGTIVSRGSCGANVTYELDDTGLLVISGEGDMEDFEESHLIPTTPWKSYPIKMIIIKRGVTSIGDYAFEANPETLLRTAEIVYIPDTVTNIGKNAFFSNQLKSVTIPESVKEIGEYAFAYCKELKTYTINGEETPLGLSSFDIESMESLETIYCKPGSEAERVAKYYNLHIENI